MSLYSVPMPLAESPNVLVDLYKQMEQTELRGTTGAIRACKSADDGHCIMSAIVVFRDQDQELNLWRRELAPKHIALPAFSVSLVLLKVPPSIMELGAVERLAEYLFDNGADALCILRHAVAASELHFHRNSHIWTFDDKGPGMPYFVCFCPERPNDQCRDLVMQPVALVQFDFSQTWYSMETYVEDDGHEVDAFVRAPPPEAWLKLPSHTVAQSTISLAADH